MCPHISVTTHIFRDMSENKSSSELPCSSSSDPPPRQMTFSILHCGSCRTILPILNSPGFVWPTLSNLTGLFVSAHSREGTSHVVQSRGFWQCRRYKIETIHWNKIERLKTALSRGRDISHLCKSSPEDTLTGV